MLSAQFLRHSLLLFVCLNISFAYGQAKKLSTITTPPNFKVAFIGDQGLGLKSQQVLHLIKQEGAQAVIHLGDFDYYNQPQAWDEQINQILGKNFPYFGVIGNHDLDKWPEYQQLLKERMQRIGLSWQGELGEQSTISYKGLLMVMVGIGTKGDADVHNQYLAQQLQQNNAIWRIAAWHKNQQAMQAGGKIDETGWQVYETARLHGAMIATGHEHSYSRSYLLSHMQQQTVDNKDNTLKLSKGKSFVFVSGLGGIDERIQRQSGQHWAKIYAKTCLALDPVCLPNAKSGALFATFNVDKQANKAKFYFKNINQQIIDKFTVISEVKP